MIRIATRSDIPVIVELLVDFMRESSYGEHVDEIDETHLKRLVFNIIHQGFIWLWIDTSKNEIAGFLAAYLEPNIWLPKKRQLRELAWYIKPHYRGKLGGGRLFVEFCRKGEELMNDQRINGYSTTRMTTSAEYDLESRGFRLTEYMYLKD